MESYILRITLSSDACFGRGDGVAGIIDREIQHDELGYPYLSGKEIKGILVNECADILSALPKEKQKRWENVAAVLFGRTGQDRGEEGILSIGPARIPDDLHKYLLYQRDRGLQNELEGIDPSKAEYEEKKEKYLNDYRVRTLNSLTGIRQQTAIGEDGVQKNRSLRTTRVIVRNCIFESAITFLSKPEDEEVALALLIACVKAFRRAGAMRNRGLGKLEAKLVMEDGRALTLDRFEPFKKEVLA